MENNPGGMTLVCEEDMTEKIGIVTRQTNYTEDIAREKLLIANMDHIKVIKDFFGIAEKKALPVKSLQQQIYKEIRHKLDDSIRDFNNKQDKKLASEIENNNK
uniref:Uncharacterized protein n=1 Tax=viral metagenome TaxID=1070528 RepID=A0A6C0HCC8_9ZZZZ